MAIAMTLLGGRDLANAPRTRIGGKAHGLAQLLALSANVPPLFVVPADHFLLALDQANLVSELTTGLDEVALLASDDPFAGRRIGEIAARLTRAVQGIALPETLQRDVSAALESIGPGPYAVRSSMVGEDGAEHSFAGQLESFLFRLKADDVLSAIRDCWASAFGERALAYLKNMSGEHRVIGLPRVGVIVQKQIAGQVSGVLFSAHPVTGRRDHSLITAAWGQGEGIVGGLCNTDEYVWELGGGEIDVKIATKDLQIVAAPNGEPGTIEQEVAPSEQNIRCLSRADVAKIADEGARIAVALGSPQDIEWTLDGGKLYILQTRPITRLPAPPSGDGPLVIWDNSNIQESYCGVTTPLTFSFARAAYATVYEQTYRMLGLPEEVLKAHRPVFANLLGLVRGRVYYNINNWYRGLLILPAFSKNKADMEKMMGLDEPVDFIQDKEESWARSWLDKARKLPRLAKTFGELQRKFMRLDRDVPAFLSKFESQLRAIDRNRLNDRSLSELMELAETTRKELTEGWTTPIINDFYVMMATGRLRRLVAKTNLENGAELIAQMMGGEEGIESTEPTRMLLRMAKTARESSALKSALSVDPPLAALSELRRQSASFAAQIDDYIDRYGDRCMGELKLETISLREDPSFVVQILRNYLDRPDLDAEKLADRERAQRKHAEATIRDALPLHWRIQLDSALKNARKAVKNRENMRLARTRGFGLYRDVYRAVGAKLRDAGRLDEPRDVFYLSIEEIADYHQGRGVSADLAPLARARKIEFAAYEREEVPHRFETRGSVGNGHLITHGRAAESVDANARLLVGTGCYPGIVEAPLKIILKATDELSVDRKILCTLRTDPGWAPLFPTASGILVERGSTLSHSAIVARELGIPAVVGVPNLLKIVAQGELVKLDGGRGTVERLDPRE